MRSKDLIVILVLAVVVVAVPTIAYQMAPKETVTHRSAGGVEYTQTNIVLDGANDTIKIPDNWNGSLVVICRDYITQENFDPNEIPADEESEIWIGKGIATAASNYGQGGMCVQEAMAKTYQLTQYVLAHYNVTGKVYLVGFSMGGSVALLLGDKYPEAYDGVLDVCSPKDYAAWYSTKMQWAELSDVDLIANLTALNLAVPSDLDAFREALNQSAADIATECGGTPQEVPTAYQGISPLYNIDLQIPVIFIVGMSDAEVLLSQNYAYYQAVLDAGESGLIHVSPVTNATHLNESVMFSVPNAFNALQYRVNSGMWLATVVCFVPGC